jgi:hypothetical protein
MTPRVLLARVAGPAARAGATLLVGFAFYAAAMDLGLSRGLVGAVASPAGLLLLLASGVLLLAGAAGALAAGAPGRAARALVRGGAGLALVALPLSLLLRDTRTPTLLEGEALEPRELPGAPLRLDRVALRPAGPHVLSMTVDAHARGEDGAPVTIGLFPPTAAGPWRVTVIRFGYAPGVEWRGPDGQLLGAGRIALGTFAHAEEEAALVQWTPETNVMMGAGTFPPRMEELVSARERGEHLFLRLEEATVAGVRRDLREADAYRWLSGGRLEDPVFFVQVIRGGHTVYAGRVEGGGGVQFDGGTVRIDRDVALWVDLLAVRDPFLPAVGVGLALLGLGASLGAGAAVRRRLRPAQPSSR